MIYIYIHILYKIKEYRGDTYSGCIFCCVYDMRRDLIYINTVRSITFSVSIKKLFFSRRFIL